MHKIFNCLEMGIAAERERKMLALLSSPQGNSLFLKGREPLIAILAKGRICVFQEGEPYILCHRNTSMDIENKLLNVHHVQVCWLAASSKKTFADKSFNEQLKKTLQSCLLLGQHISFCFSLQGRLFCRNV